MKTNISFKKNVSTLAFTVAIVTTSLIGAIAQANAGNSSGGGGGAVISADGKATLLDLVEPIEHRYFDPRNFVSQTLRLGLGYSWELIVAAGCKPGVPNPAPAANFCNSFAKYIHVTLGAPSGQSDFDWAVTAPKELIWIFTSEPLEQLKDEGLIRNVDPTTLIQVAVQKDGIVVVHEPTFNKMDQRSKDALFMHETLVRIVSETNLKLIKEQGTASIRKFNKMFIERYFGGFIPDEVYQKAFADLHIPSLIK